MCSHDDVCHSVELTVLTYYDNEYNYASILQRRCPRERKILCLVNHEDMNENNQENDKKYCQDQLQRS